MSSVCDSFVDPAMKDRGRNRDEFIQHTDEEANKSLINKYVNVKQL